jgi:CRISPR-associated endonuclease/helicase Cas3
MDDFVNFFKKATNFEPYYFQKKFAYDKELPDIINIPTGLGKTECIVIGWLWKRFNENILHSNSNTPRRLVYSLPMRTLVEQVYNKVHDWIQRLNLQDQFLLAKIIGGESDEDWDLYPEKNVIIIGTQDMLLSRALNRGYGMSRFRWPVQFGLLNNDSLWVFDEIQLMGGSAIKTTVQLDAFRTLFGVSKKTKTIWMSATTNNEWLETVDSPNITDKKFLRLNEPDMENEHISSLIKARKNLQIMEFNTKELNETAKEIVKKHKQNTRTFAIFNTVKKATDISKYIEKLRPGLPVVLIHSQFREEDRKKNLNRLINEKNAIVVSTQVIEAGIDVSCRTLFTELAPLHSLIQRFGRCNRYAEFEDAEIIVLNEYYDGAKNITNKDKDLREKEKNALPYEYEDLKESLEILNGIHQGFVSIETIPEIKYKMNTFEHVIRKKDILELFDTTRDISGNDTDISFYVRERSEFNAQVFWRDIAGRSHDAIDNEDFPAREELCSAPLSDLRELVKKKISLWEKDWYDGGWTKIKQLERIIPGKIIMISSDEGYYSNYGWDLSSKDKVKPILHGQIEIDASDEGDPYSEGNWKSIEQHSDEVVAKAKEILLNLGLSETEEDYILKGSRWHDSGKAHPAFQAKIRQESVARNGITLPAKAPKDAWFAPNEAEGRNYRKYFRHELASGLLALHNGEPDIVAYLATSHHGKVRVSIRSMPNEMIPDDGNKRFARGLWDDDTVPSVNLGGGIIVPSTTLNLDLMEIGGGTTGKSWISRVTKLYKDPKIGIFRLSYYEGIIRSADRRASGGFA